MAERALLSRWFRLTLGLLALTVGGGVVVRLALHRGPDLEGLLRQLPADTSNVVVLQHLDRLLPALTALAGRPGAPPELAEAVAGLRRDSLAQAGFDATTPDGWRTAGFALGGSFALAAPVEADGLLFAYLPVRDGDAALATLSRILANLGAQVEARPGPPSSFRVSWPAARTEPLPRAFALARGNLVLALARAELADLDARLARQLQGEGLLHSAALKRIRAELPEPWVLLGFVSPAQAQRALAERAQGATGLQAMAGGGVGFSLLLSDARVSGRIRILSDPASPQGEAHRPPVKPPVDHLGGAPLAIARVSLDLPGWLATLEATPDGRAQLQALQRLLASRGVDAEAELTQTLDGQVAAAVLAPTEPGGWPDGALLVGLKDPSRARALLPKLLEGLPLQPDVAGWYRMPQVAVGVSGDALVALFGEARIPQGEASTVANRGPSLAVNLPPEVQQAYAQGPLLYAWADLERAAQVLAHGRAPGLAGRERMLRGLQGASVGLDAKPGVISLDADLWPPPGGFSRAIEGAPSDAGAR